MRSYLIILLIAIGAIIARAQSIPNPIAEYFSASMPSSYPYGGVTVEADLYEYYSGVLDNPIIVVDGFDPGNERNWWETNGSDDPGLYELLNQENMLEDARTLGYDFIVVDNLAGADYIQRNAYLLMKIIDLVNARKSGNNELIIVGPSMGGLISRTALKWMEDEGRDHHTRLWVSFDSPHQGANVPLGLQHWIKFFSSMNDDVNDALSKLRQPAGKQMLIYHESGGSTNVCEERNNFITFLNDLGYPEDLRKIAISNGSGIGNIVLNNAGNPMSAGDQILKWEHWDPAVNLKGNAWALPANSTKKIFEGKIGFSLPAAAIVTMWAWAFAKKESTKNFTSTSSYCYDIMPGGMKMLPFTIADNEVPLGDITTNSNNVCHIPLYSSLSIPINFNPNILANHSVARSFSPFDEIYYSNLENEEHIHISNKTYEDFFKELVPVRAIVSDGWDEGNIIATESIYVAPGFKSKPGQPLKLEVNPNVLNLIGL